MRMKIPTMRALEKTVGAALVGGISMTAASSAYAYGGYLDVFNELYGTAGTRLDTCGLCHNNFGGVGPGNPYYAAFQSQASGDTTAFQAIEGVDSDGDGTSNGNEIADLFMPGWNCDNLTNANNAPADLNAFVDPSNPGCGAALVPDIAVSPLNLDYGAVNVGATSSDSATIGNVGTADLTVTAVTFGNGSSTDFTLNPAPATPFIVAPNNSVDVTVDYTPGEGGQDSGTLVIASDDPVTPEVTVSLSGTGFAPPPGQCNIGVAPPTLDFGTVEIGMTVSLATTVSNAGTVDCTVSASVNPTGEFVLSSLTPFTVSPGGSQGVTVDYTPIDVGDDSGTLELTSNDPAQPSVTVPLAGSGIEAPALVVDLDIAQFKVTKRVSLRHVKPIGIQLTVKNNGVVNETRVATVTGMQQRNGVMVEVYREAMDVSDAVGNGRTKFDFLSFTPDTVGDINWTATIADDDPDDDVAVATTTVVD